MVYLDYAANAPACEEVLQTYLEVSRQYIANPSSNHPLGTAARTLLQECTRKMAALLNVEESEIIYTSGASESNNLAIKGVAEKYKKRGKHIITTYLEHSSVNGAIAALVSAGYEVDYVDITQSGLVDVDHLQELLRVDTILVSICYVESEVGIRQDIEKIAKLLLRYPNCTFHVDATQAVGKIPVSLSQIDLVSFAPHKFYGLNGSGVLLKKEAVLLEPLIHGGISTTPFRSGTPDLAQIAAAEKALSLAVAELEPRYKTVEVLHKKLKAALVLYPKIKVNSTNHSVPFIFNISILGAKSEDFQAELGKREICVSTKSACCAPNTVSRPVYAIGKDKKAALSTLRISLSHLTTMAELDVFLDGFECCYRKFIK